MKYSGAKKYPKGGPLRLRKTYMLKKNHTGKVSQCGKTGDIFLNMQSDTISKILLHLQNQKTPEGIPLTLKTAETAENPIFGKK